MKMKHIAAVGTILLASAYFGNALAQEGQGKAGKRAAKPELTLTSPGFEDGGIIPEKFTRASANPVSPKLEWTNVAPETASFVLLMHDIDVAGQKKTNDITHWMAFNIPGTATSIAEGQPAEAKLPDGTIQIVNSGRTVGFIGPNHAAGGPYHHYTFELFALDTKLDLGPDATRDAVIAAIQGHIVDKAVLMGRFKRRD
jgi:Raf kinase inhibitor-like YbhB/YbcL family protein